MNVDRMKLGFGLLLSLTVTSSSACTYHWGYDDELAGQETDAGLDEGTTSEREPASYQALSCLTTPSEEGTEVPESCAGGQVLYQVGDEVFRSTLSDGIATENLSECLDQHWPGSDLWVTPSLNAEWLLMLTDRFHEDCADWACVAVLRDDLSEAEIVKVDGVPLHIERHGAIQSDGQEIIYPSDGGPHIADLFALGRVADGWGTPLLLSADSPYEYNQQPALSPDGSKLVFDCGDDPYSQSATAICEVNTDGTGFRVVWSPEGGATNEEGSPEAALHHATYSADGSILFEANWNGERIWRIDGTGLPTLVTNQTSNDNSPCALPSGCIVSLWLEHPDNPAGLHEMKIMDADGNSISMLRTAVDVVDLGTGCGG